jgi:hypothetical protein
MKINRLAGRFLAVSGLAAILAMGADRAHADIVTTLTSATNVVGGSDWTYTVVIDAQETASLSAGAFFTVYDFGTQTFLGDTGLLTSDFTYSDPATNTHAINTTPIDTALLNAHFVMTSGANIVGPQTLGTFTLFSPLAAPLTPCTALNCAVVNFDGQAILTASGLPQGDIGFTFAPVPGPILGAGLPGLLAACGALLALGRRRRQQLA